MIHIIDARSIDYVIAIAAGGPLCKIAEIRSQIRIFKGMQDAQQIGIALHTNDLGLGLTAACESRR